ncbi:ESF1 homolog [Venturia canescens]|uniref:ESF1 homolog n=1 Tax=Venturia canescens TaxID=32260 RepID=UPI001C9D5FA2|nr:ESF1 homolog [Venturia canescens]
MDEMLKDKRFAHIAKDPKFRRIPKSERKVKIDKRFRSMFEDKKFTVKYTIDKRGRPINQTSTENLRKYYDLSSSEDEKEEEKTKEFVKSKKKVKDSKKIINKSSNSKKVPVEENISNENSGASNSDVTKDSDVDNNELEENEQQLFVREKNERNRIDKSVKQKLRDLTIDYARGEGVLLTDSSSEEESSQDEDEEETEIEHDWGELDKEAETTDEITHRLAACNMDWDRMRAVDLMVLFNSFLPPGGLIKSVTIYPSDFGLQRMKEEEVKGPIELVDSDKKRKDSESEEESENEEGSEYHMEKMRQYQLNRLKYYYAVLECDSVETANKIYTECDGIEYESTSTKLDLRFIPNDMEFEHEPREVCDKLPDLSKYKPRQFTTTALQQVKVELTWDETNPERQEIAEKIKTGKLDEINENDIQAYLASGTSDEESEDQDVNKEIDSENDNAATKNPIDKYKLLLKSIEDQEEAKKKQEVELEFTWGLGAKEKTEKLVKERMNMAETLTPFEQYLEKRREKKRAKREERKKLRERSEDEEDSDSDDSVPSDVDMNDPYFAEEMKNMKSKKKMKKKSRLNENNSSDEEEEIRRKAELELLLLEKGDEQGKRHFNIKKIEEEATLSKSKRKRLDKKNKKNDKDATMEDDFQVNVADPRFAALYSSHHYNIDPADPHYRKTKGTEALISEKLKRRADTNIVEESPKTKQTKKDGKMSADLAALVKSVKRNTKNIAMPIK